MKKATLLTSLAISLCLASTSSFSTGISVQGSSAYPNPKNAKILSGNYSIDVLVDLVPDGIQNAYGDSNPPQGMLRDVSAIDLQGTPIPQVGPLPLGRGMHFIVTGTIYPGGALSNCTLGNACVPSAPSIGNWICTGWTLADANSWAANGSDAGRALNFVTTVFNIKDLRKNYFGDFILSGLEGNAFADTTTTYPLAVVGKNGSFTTVNPYATVSSKGFVGVPPPSNPFQPGLKIVFNVDLKSSQ